MPIPRARLLGTLAVLVLLAGPLGAQTPAPLPAADDLIDAYLETVGGRDALLAPESVRQTGSVLVSGLGLEGTFERIDAAPNRTVMRVSLPAMGEVVTGFDGTTGWTLNPLVGAMLMEGAELAQTREMADARAAVRDAELVPVRETVEAAEYGGEACWKVRLEWASGRESFDCYSRTTGLLIASEEVQSSPLGDLPVVTLFPEYRSFGAVTLPARIRQSSAGQTLEIVVREVEFGSVEAAEFDPPPSVQTLLGGATGG